MTKEKEKQIMDGENEKILVDKRTLEFLLREIGKMKNDLEKLSGKGRAESG